MAHLEGDRSGRRKELHRLSRRTHLLRAALVGVAAGLFGVLYQVGVGAVEGFSRQFAQSARESWLGGVGVVVAAAGVGAVSTHLVGTFVPEAGGSGIPHIKAALLHLRRIRAVPILIAKLLGGFAALSTGMSLGREGPTVQMGSCAGKIVGDLTKAPRRGRDSLIASGGGAGLAAAFNAPLAGFLFVMEELKRDMSALTYGAALIASVCAVFVTRLLIGQHASFNLRSPGVPPLSELPVIAILGLVAGLGGVLFNKSLMAGLVVRDRLRLPRWLWGGLAGGAAMAALLRLPSIAGGGHELASHLLSGSFRPEHVVLSLSLLFLGKLVLTSASYSTGLPGGIFAPILAIGAVLGFGFGVVAHAVSPALRFSPEGYATVGMAALLAGSVRAPLTGVVLIVEMTGEYSLLYALLISAFVADVVADFAKDMPIYEALMERDLHLSGAEAHPDDEPILIEFMIEPNSAMDGRRVKNLRLPAGAILFTLERGSRHIVPGGSTVLQAGDTVSVLVEGDKPELSSSIHDAARAP